ncbi:M48 family metallopeptidase [Aliarcobacter cryaerophilus]|uniref:M48 family metallopeptidase n=1 Tax=Aliarcobacter cryaerophilus TaxID=28198 RepID=UPI0021B50C53|nr:M48 family metallopeptidase [Aliarcobacter cryaerophilus]MCT7542040.1 M48 family metallopeptidase [Aliarcobacter cryaerophilus]
MRIILNFSINPLLSIFATFLTFIHFMIVAIPFYMAIIPLIKYVKENNIIYLPNDLFTYIIIGMFSISIIYLLIDLIFGFTVEQVIQNTKEIKKLNNFKLEQELFEEVIEKFDIKNVKFMIEESNEINAYAVASFRKKYVVITTSILKHILNSFETEEERKDALKGLIGHELSHLINWDFLPNLILISGENVSIHVQKFFSLFLNVLIVLFRIIPILGAFLSLITVYTYNFLSYFMTYSYKLLIRPTYNLFERFLSRRIEYRCDYQSAQALNWQSMYLILYSLLSLDGNTYHSPFSTHPNTISRILNIYNIKNSKKRISVNFISKYFGIFILSMISLFLVYFYIYKSYKLLQYINYIKIEFNTLTNIVIEQVFRMKKVFTNILDLNMSMINFLPREYENYFILFALLIFLLFCLFLKQWFLKIRINLIKNKINKEFNTVLDTLLLYAILNNDIKSFIKILKYGANIKSTYFRDDIIDFTKQNNPKFLKYLNQFNL